MLRFSKRRKDAKLHGTGHRQWLKEGFARRIFLAAGGLTGGDGGCILAYNTTRSGLRRLLKADPFIAHDVVTADIFAFAPALMDKRLNFLTEESA